MENDKKIWSEEDINYLKDNYTEKGSNICSLELKRSRKAIVVKARRLGLKAGQTRDRYRQEVLEPIIMESTSLVFKINY